MKMNKNVTVMFSLAMIGAALVISRGNAMAQSEYKIGVVNTQVVIDNYDRHEDELAKLAAQANLSQKVLDELKSSVDEAFELYDAQKDSLSEDDREALEEEILSDRVRADAEYQRFQQDLDRKFDRVRREVFEEIQEAVKAIALEENYHLVLEGRDAFPPSVLHYAAPLDISQKVVDRLNADYEKS